MWSTAISLWSITLCDVPLRMRMIDKSNQLHIPVAVILLYASQLSCAFCENKHHGKCISAMYYIVRPQLTVMCHDPSDLCTMRTLTQITIIHTHTPRSWQIYTVYRTRKRDLLLKMKINKMPSNMKHMTSVTYLPYTMLTFVMTRQIINTFIYICIVRPWLG